jgi:serine phosphatase RsbU (regulator of sigma subunit)
MDQSHCRILLVDDVKDNINILVQALKGEYQLGFALCGEAALKYVDEHHPDLILLDIMMPGMDGYEVCRRLQAHPQTSGIPVIFLSSMDEVGNKAAGFAAGAVDYITKPFEILEVKARVKTHLALKLARQELEQQRDHMQLSLDLAMEVQQNLLPQTAPRIQGVDLAGRSIYCDETGGDYFDFLVTGASPAREVGLVVGDVSEHGIPSALLMTSARAYLRQRSYMAGSLAQVVSDVNRQFCRDVKDSGRFMTLFLGRINTAAMELTWVRAGHDPALLYDPRADHFEELGGPGLPLGVQSDFQFEEHHGRLVPGCILLIGTDGIWEARDRGDRQFGKARLQEVVRTHAAGSADQVVQGVVSAVNKFMDGLPAQDDITLLVAKMD